MRNIPSLLNTHLQGELLTIADCLTIERNDGVVLRMTNHDKDLVVNGQTYTAGASFVTSALKTSADLSVDNMQLDIGLDGELIAKVDLDSDLFKRARFEIISTNWQAPQDGSMILARGWIGDITVRNVAHATLQLRGLTQALQRNFLSYYSPTCRASFGDSKCGVPATPFTLHKRNHRYKVGDWALVPVGQTAVPLTNGSFEAQGVVANGSSGITEWTHGPGSYWSVGNSFAGKEGSYYLAGGDDSGVAPAGTVFSIYREIGTSAMGMAGVNVDAGNYIVGVSAFLSSSDAGGADNGRITLTMLSNSGVILKVVSSPYARGTYGEWQEIRAASFVVPGTRRIKFSLEGVKTTGAVKVAFDDVSISYWNADAAAYPAAYKVVRIPGYSATDRRLPSNYRFVEDGEVSNDTSGISGWTYGSGSYFRVASNASGLSPDDGAYFLVGGDDGSTTPATVYELSSAALSLTDLNATVLADGGYIVEAHVRVANIVDLDSQYRAKLVFYNSSNVEISNVDSGYASAPGLATWRDLAVSGTAPVGTASAKIILYAKSGSGSAANVAFDSVRLFVMNTTLANLNDATMGDSAAVRPAFGTTVGDFIYDGDLIWQAHNVSFGFDTVLNATDRRVFLGTSISGGEGSYYGAQIIWLTGANAGTTSFVRTWVPATKELRLYGVTANPIAGGDKFMYSQGCGKSITDCAERFNNAVNFRGEPYLPGPQRVIELFTPNA